MEIAKLKSAIESEMDECRGVKNNTLFVLTPSASKLYQQAHTELQAYSKVLEIIHELEVEGLRK